MYMYIDIWVHVDNFLWVQFGAPRDLNLPEESKYINIPAVGPKVCLSVYLHTCIYIYVY